MEKLVAFIEKLQRERKVQTLGEEATKQSIILPVLSNLQWQVFDSDEVFPEFSIGNTRVDYALRDRLNNKVFIEVKRIDLELDKHQEQLLQYAFREGVKLAVLTNGILWWFYLPLHEGSWEERKFFTIDIYSQLATDIAQNFSSFLRQEEVFSGSAVRNAEQFYNNKQKGEIVRQTMQKAWRKLLEEPDEILVELLSETTEKICGYRPDNSTASEFLINAHSASIYTTVPAPKNKFKPIPRQDGMAVGASAVKEHHTRAGDFTKQRVSSFTFFGRTHKIASWKELLTSVSSLIIERHPEDKFPHEYERLLSLKGRKRNYYSLDAHKLFRPAEVGNNLFVESNLSANDIVKIVRNLLSIFGYDADSLIIDDKAD